MKILFVHQNFPGQYEKLIPTLLRNKQNKIVSIRLGKNKDSFNRQLNHDNLKVIHYSLERGNTPGIHPWALETESKLIRAEACAKVSDQLKKDGFVPDLICAHPGWGEAMFLKTIWPSTPLLCYQEFFYQNKGYDLDFDPELQSTPDWKAQARTVMKNAYLQVTLEQADWNVSPTYFQRSSFPAQWQNKISVIHDGVDTQLAAPDLQAKPFRLTDSLVIQQGEPIVTFVNRSFEPYRGCHTFLRAIPQIQAAIPKAQIIIIGRTQGVSYGSPCPSGEWKDHFLSEIEGSYDASRVHFVGAINYSAFLHLLKLSACHVYLTYPFVLSWSLLEAMSTGCGIVGSSTAPVQEVIKNGKNGLLVDFFKPDDLATAVIDLLNHPKRAASLGNAARQTVLENYSLEHCVPRHLALMELVASRALNP